MNDPSQPILALAFALTLICSIAAIVIRSQPRRRNELSTESLGEGESTAAPALRQDAPPALRQDAPPALPMGKVKTWFFRPWDLAGAFILYGVFAGLFALSCVAPPVQPEDFTAGLLVFNMIFQFMLAAGVTAAALRLTNLDQWLGWRWKNWPWLFLIGPGAVALMLTIFWLLQLTGYIEWMESLGVETIQETVTMLQECRDPLVLTLLVITATLVAPVCEEVVFRGYLHPILKKFGGVWAAALCSSLLFSIAHGNLTVMLPLFLLGLLLVWLYELTGSIWTPIVVHFCFNATTVLAQLATRDLDIPSAFIPKLPF